MRVPLGEARVEVEAKRSRFVAYTQPIGDATDVQTVIRQYRDEHQRAAHVVYAFACDADNSTKYGMSDDGEPKGTGGRPVLEVLRGSAITDCLIAVVRYYGGIKLGTGGLVRAYGDAARRALAAVRTAEKRVTHQKHVVCPYSLHKQLTQALSSAGAEIVGENFSGTVEVTIEFERVKLDRITEVVRDVSRGTIDLI